MSAAFAPVGLLELELADPQRRLGWVGDVRAHGRVRALVRLHGTPLGLLDATAPELSYSALAERARSVFRAAIDAHARDDPLRERAAFRERAPFATVVVATRERAATLAATLDDLLALDYPRFEVIVVDNAPVTDATYTLVARRAAEDPRLRYETEPLAGLAVAHNRGLGCARGAVIAFTDDDVHVDGLWLLELARAFEWDDDVACATGLIMPAELETPAQLWIEDCVGVNKGYEARLFDTGSHRPPGRLFPYAAGIFGSGANMAFRTDALRALGGFDPATGTGTCARGGDDLAAFYTVVTAGHTLAYQPAAIVYHLHRSDLAGLRRQMFEYGAGLGAFLTKVVVDRPAALWDIAWRVPFGARHATRARSGGPRSLTRPLLRRERLGMLAGPAGYLVERRRRRALYGPRGDR